MTTLQGRHHRAYGGTGRLPDLLPGRTDWSTSPRPSSTEPQSSGHLPTKLAGAYWRGDNNKMLTESMAQHARPEEAPNALAEAEARPSLSESTDSSWPTSMHPAPFFLPKGEILYTSLSAMRSLLVDSRLRRRSNAVMLTPSSGRRAVTGTTTPTTCSLSARMRATLNPRFRMNASGLKPMNCPSHMLIFAAQKRSIGSLPFVSVTKAYSTETKYAARRRTTPVSAVLSGRCPLVRDGGAD